MKNKHVQLPYFYLICFITIISALPLSLVAQHKSKAYDSYISTYQTLAVQHMYDYKIPASITLAQGLLESGAGKSMLATVANNHFGIKCHKEWQGEGVYKDDDKKNECFRKYKHAQESFDDHSRFLTSRAWYKPLFELATNDYRGWARGLQKSGYATDKTYANKLIKIIEDYQLYQYDAREWKKDAKKEKIIAPIFAENKLEKTKKNVEPKTVKKKSINESTLLSSATHTPYKTHDLVYVIANENDTFEAIANEFGFNTKDLYTYNEVPKGFPLKEGDLVYFKEKNKRAPKLYNQHIIQIGESMHSIAQKYGMRIKELYRMNKKTYEYVPVEDDILKLR